MPLLGEDGIPFSTAAAAGGVLVSSVVYLVAWNRTDQKARVEADRLHYEKLIELHAKTLTTCRDLVTAFEALREELRGRAR